MTTPAPEGAAAPIIVRHVHVENFLGLTLFDAAFPAGGAVIAGRNGGGKTSVLKAISAALTAQGVSQDAIRLGAKSGEIRVDLGDVTVQRLFTEKGSKLKVSRPDGSVYPAPQGFLDKLLGATLDPLAFWQEKDPKKRRKLLLEALPVEVTPTMLRAWCNGAATDADIAEAIRVDRGWFAPENEDKALPGHGLDVVEALRAALYARRTEANRATKSADDEAGRAESAARSANLALGGEPILAVIDAQAELGAIAAEEGALAARTKAAERAVAGRARAEGQVATLRRQAEERRAAAPAEPSAEEIEAAEKLIAVSFEGVQRCASLVEELEKQLAEAQAALGRAQQAESTARAARGKLRDLAVGREAALAQAASLKEQADSLESALGDAPAAPTSEEVAALGRRRVAAEAALDRARKGQEFDRLETAARAARASAETARRASSALDAAVKSLAGEAPKELLAGAEFGDVQLEGDTVRLGGVAFDNLCGAERARFAVRLAKALNRRSRILLVDGLEAIDPEALPAFVEEATSGGWQLIGTRVERGDARVEPIVPSEALS